jgi:hypothetical protein
MRKPGICVSTLAIALAAGSTVAGQPRTAAQEAPGVKVGDAAPKFTLKDQTGNDRSLDELLKTGKVALVFYRSADW